MILMPIFTLKRKVKQTKTTNNRREADPYRKSLRRHNGNWEESKRDPVYEGAPGEQIHIYHSVSGGGKENQERLPGGKLC